MVTKLNVVGLQKVIMKSRFETKDLIPYYQYKQVLITEKRDDLINQILS
jgi:hypothetical protein